MDTGGKPFYMGGLKQFEEYAAKYYAISPSTDTELEAQMAQENLQTFEQGIREKREAIHEPPFRICLTNANSALCYHLAFQLAAGNVLGDQMIAIHLYSDQPSAMCEGLAMELQDLSSAVLEYVTYTTSMQDAFDTIDMLFVLDYPYTPLHLEKKDGSTIPVITAATLFQDYVQTLDSIAKKTVRVILSGCYANIGATVMASFVSSLSPSRFVAAPCLAESQAKALIGNRVQLNSNDIQHMVVWGRTHGKVLADPTFIEVSHFPGAVVGPDPFSLPLTRCEFDMDWLSNQFPTLMSARHGQLEGYGEEGPALAEAVGLARLAHYWIHGQDKWISVGLISDGTKYDIPKGMAFSVPCQCKDGVWKVVANLDVAQNIKVSSCTPS